MDIPSQIKKKVVVNVISFYSILWQNVTLPTTFFFKFDYTGLFTRGVFLNFFLPQPIIHIATIS
jgi:hypothetical protein